MKKRILIFTHYFLPGYKAGGPIQSIANFVKNVSDEFEVYIVTSDRDAFDKDRYLGIIPDRWVLYNGLNVHYTSPEKRSLKYFNRVIRETPHDILYLNSFFNKPYSLYPILVYKLWSKNAKSIVLAPRGEFSAGALLINKLKKKLFTQTVLALTLYDNVIWQASSDYEKQDILKVIGSKSEPTVKIASNIPESFFDETIIKIENNDNVFRIIYLSRVSPKKNLAFALKVIESLKIPIEFNIYGLIDDDEYWEQCQEIIKRMPQNVTIKYYGAISHDSVKEVLLKHHLFFLPTKGENYGHVIAEALSVGTPVLISDTTPWRGLEKDNVGWDLSLEDMNAFINVIARYYESFRNGDSYSRNQIKKWYRKYIDTDSIIEDNKQLFRNI